MGLFDLTGKVAVITGSSKGIGRAIAERMAEHGAKVVVSSRKLDLCEEVVKGIKDKGGEAIAVACNIGRKEECASLIEKAKAAFGKVDILVCNAAINPYYGPLLDISDEAFDKIIPGRREDAKFSSPPRRRGPIQRRALSTAFR